MAFVEFADPYCMFDSTPVENLFIEEYMPRAPGEYVKVYLYGLRLCYHPDKDAAVEGIARVLGLEEKTVGDAFTYWERQGIVRRLSDRPPSYAYLNLKAVLISGAKPEEDTRAYRAFNGALQEMFGARLLTAQEFERAHGWIEDLGLKPEVVLVLVSHCIKSSGKGQKVTFASMEKEALRWAKKGVTTLPAAEDYLRTLSRSYEGAARVLKELRLRRAPTVGEEELYAKWTGDWGFTLDAVLFACRETTKISNPNFAYVDKVLSGMRARSTLTSAQMSKAQSDREARFAPVRQVLEALGAREAPTEDLAALYASWREAGFAPEAIERAARYALRRGGSRMQDVDRLLTTWGEAGLHTPEAIDAYLEARRRRTAQLKAIFDAAGVSRRMTAADYAQLEAWQGAGVSMELLELAAEYSRHADNPMAFMAKVVEGWRQEGIQDAAAARAAHERFTSAAAAGGPRGAAPGGGQDPARPSREVGAHRFAQRDYTDEELDALYDDLEKLAKGE